MTISSIKFSFTIFCCHSHNSRTQLCSMKLKLLWMGYAWSWIPRWELQTHFQCLKGAHRDRYSPCLPYRTPLGCVSLPIFHMASQGPCSPCLAGPGSGTSIRPPRYSKGFSLCTTFLSIWVYPPPAPVCQAVKLELFHHSSLFLSLPRIWLGFPVPGETDKGRKR